VSLAELPFHVSNWEIANRDWLGVLCPQWKSLLKELIGVSTHTIAGSIPICKTRMGHTVQVAQGRKNESNCQSNRQSQNTNQSCQNLSEEHNHLGNLTGPKGNENCGQCPDNEHITTDSHVGAMF
jgi:hypothetical protein